MLRGPNDRAQLLVAGRYASGQLHDLTHDVAYQATPAGIVDIAKDGFVTPLSDGEVTITATPSTGQAATTKCRVESFSSPRPINFANEIVPIFTKAGCNAGGCHGKSGGQNGFRHFYSSEPG